MARTTVYLMQPVSLFSPPTQSVFGGLSNWLDAQVIGELAIALCTVAVALVGFRMLSGHMSPRLGMRILLGVFLLLGAPVVAASIVSEVAPRPKLGMLPIASQETPRDLKPSTDHPYGRASVRQD